MQPPPTFSSFRPKQAPSVPGLTEEPRAKEHRSRSPRSHRTHRHDPRRSSTSAPDRETSLVENSNEVFFVDRKGDVGNQTYGANNKSTVPIYWPTSTRTALGNQIGAHGHESRAARPLSALTRDDRSKLKHEGHYVGSALAAGSNACNEITENFVSLNPGKKRKRPMILGEPAAFVSHRNELINPPVESDNEDISASDSSSRSGVEPDATTSDITSDMKQENARLSNLVEREPWNVQAWLEYVKYQDIWIKQGSAHNEDHTGAENRSIAAVKFSMYMKAANLVARDDKGRQTLLIEMMHEAELVLESAKLASKWREVAEANRHFHFLWLRYLDFSQSSFSNFGFETCRDRYTECLQLRDFEKDPSVFRTYVFIRVTTFLSDTGYQELATALWQAILEFNCFRPTGKTEEPTGSLSDPRSWFEEFWESEQPRLGEDGALGWCNTITAVPPENVVGYTNSIRAEDPVNDSPARWLQNEVSAIENSMMPGRTMDETAGEDPYHVVLFSDILPFLIDVPVDQHPTALVDAFLCYQRLPALRTDHEQHRLSTFWRDAFLRNTSLDGPETHDSAQTDDHSSDRILDCLLDHHQTTVDTLFGSDSTNGSSLLSFRTTVIKRVFISNVLRALINRYPHWNDIAEYYLAFEMHTNSPPTAKKIARTLLKARPSNLRLYNAYGLIEARTNNIEAADRVLSTAIGMSATLGPGDRQDIILLWRSWIWEAFYAGDNIAALERLLALGRKNPLPLHRSHGRPINDAEVFQAQEHLTAGIHTSLSRSQNHNAVYNMELISLLQYLILPTSPSLPAALSSYTAHISFLSSHISTKSNAPTLELLHQSRAHLLSYHIQSTRPYRPADIRAALAESIALFPTNSMFLTLYAENERRFRVDDRVRQITRESLQIGAVSAAPNNIEDGVYLIDGVRDDNDNMITHAFGILTELRRGVAAGSTAYAVRAAFERAVGSRRCRYSPAIWTAWVSYECSLLSPPTNNAAQLVLTGSGTDDKIQTQQKRTKDVFYRGLRHLPWVKRYAMLAFSLLKPQCVLSSEECKGVYEVLVEKGIRIFCDLEDAE